MRWNKLPVPLVSRQLSNVFNFFLCLRCCGDQFWILFLYYQREDCSSWSSLYHDLLWCKLLLFFSSEFLIWPFVKHEFLGFSGWFFLSSLRMSKYVPSLFGYLSRHRFWMVFFSHNSLFLILRGHLIISICFSCFLWKQSNFFSSWIFIP